MQVHVYVTEVLMIFLAIAVDKVLRIATCNPHIEIENVLEDIQL